MPRARALTLLTVFWLFHGCAGPAAPVAMRDPAYRPAEIRRPAVVLQISLDQTGLGEGEFSSPERAGLPEQLEAGFIEGLNGRGIVPLDVALTALRAYRGGEDPFERVDRGQALARARALQADVLLVVDMHLARRDRVFCREVGRPAVARGTTVMALTLEVLRVSDGRRLLLEPPGAGLTVTDVEVECAPERRARRLSAAEMSEKAASQIVTRLMRR